MFTGLTATATAMASGVSSVVCRAVLRLWIGVPLALCAFVLVGSTSAASEADVQLTIALNGKGTLTGAPRRIECRGTCKRSSTVWTFRVKPGSAFTLKARAARTYKFTGWKGACRGSKPTCVVRVQRTTRLSATFVPPGARENPVPLGQTADVGDDFRLRIVSVTPDASAQFGPNFKPPPGAQQFMALITVTYTGGGKGSVLYFRNHLWAQGSHNVKYDFDNDYCGPWPEPSLQYKGDLFSGQSLTGNVCFMIASNDAASLMFFTEMDYQQFVWFALR